jgi:hypothetical protein
MHKMHHGYDSEADAISVADDGGGGRENMNPLNCKRENNFVNER